MPTTLSAEQFKQKYGQKGLDKFKVTISAAEFQKMKQLQQPQEQPGFFSRLGEDLSKRGTSIKSTVQEVGTGKIGGLEGALQTVGAVAGGVGDVISEGISSIPGVNTAMEKFSQTSAGQAVGKGFAKYEDWAKLHPRAAKDLESVVNIASLIPAEKVVGTVGEFAGKTAAKTTGKVLQKTGSILEKTGNVAESTAKLVSNNAFTPNIKEAEMLQKFKASVPLKQRVNSFFTGETLPGMPRTTGATALEKGIMGTEGSMGVQAAQKSQSLWKDTIQPAVASIEEKLTKKEIFSDIQKGIDKVKDATTKKSWQEGFDSIKQDYKKYKDFTYEEAQSIKSELDRKIPAKMFRGKDVTGSANNIRKLMADSIRNRTYQVLKDVNIKKDYIDYCNLKNIMEHGAKSMTKGQFKGGAGSFISAAYEMAVTPIKTVGSQVLYKSANGLRFLGKKGLKKFGQYLEDFVK